MALLDRPRPHPDDLMEQIHEQIVYAKERNIPITRIIIGIDALKAIARARLNVSNDIETNGTQDVKIYGYEVFCTKHHPWYVGVR